MSYKKRIYQAAVSQRLRNTADDMHWISVLVFCSYVRLLTLATASCTQLRDTASFQYIYHRTLHLPCRYFLINVTCLVDRQWHSTLTVLSRNYSSDTCSKLKPTFAHLMYIIIPVFLLTATCFGGNPPSSGGRHLDIKTD